MKQLLTEHFAVFVVMTVFFALFTAYLMESHWGTKVGALDWLEGEMKETIAAILMGLTGKGVVQVVSKPDTPAEPPK